MSSIHTVLITAFLISDRRLIRYAATINSDECGFDFHEALEYFGEEAERWRLFLPEFGGDIEIMSVELIDGHLTGCVA